MLAFIIAAVAQARGLSQDETGQLYQVVQIIMTRKALDITTIGPRQAWAVLNYAVDVVTQQSRGSATGTPADPNNPPAG